MKNIKLHSFKNTLVLGLIIMIGFSCERELSDDAVNATFPKIGEIFTDDFVGMGTDFYLPYNGSKATAWTVDRTQGYNSTASWRFDVPNATDLEGNYAGAIFRADNAGRDLSGFDALTFWVKASRGVTIDEFGFGEDFLGNKYMTSIKNVSVGTNWSKVIIPIPNAAKLIQERGMFRYAAGTQATAGSGYTFWIDDIKFEKLGTIKLLDAKILGGQNVIVDGFLNSTHVINQLTATSNLANGQNITVSTAPSYFTFFKSDSNLPIANRVLDDLKLIEEGQQNAGQIFTKVIGLVGSATVTAQLGNTLALGSLKINAAGSFVNAPTPTQNPANVTSIFSDTYTTIPGFNPGTFAGPATGSISAPVNGGNQHLNYQSIDFIGMGWTGVVNASSRTMMHLDVKLIGPVGANLRVELKDFGPDGVDNNFGAGGDTAGGNNISGQLIQDQWVSVNIPLNQFTLPTGGGGAGNPNRSNLGFIILVSSNGASFLVDNIYFY
jgi:hypothetical protein